MKLWNSCRFHEISGSQYLIFSDFMRYFTRHTTPCMFLLDIIKNTISIIFRLNEIFHQYHNSSKLQILWDIIRISISQSYRFHEIPHQDHNISQLQISWDISPRSCFLIVEDQMRFFTRMILSHHCSFVCLSCCPIVS